ncbi:MAG: quinone-dependent dihydroorotate dehydrogenase [Candidatus Dormibacteria bacterium]
MLYPRLMRPVLFALSRRDPEIAHELVVAQLVRASGRPILLRFIERWSGASDLHGHREFWGLKFRSPVGLAAGFDKNGLATGALAAFGFGFIEAGTVTWHSQPGHPRPRIWRFPPQRSIVNAMGFPNRGASAAAAHAAASPAANVPVGWNISKSRVTPLADTLADCRASLRVIHPHADYVAVNVSSPNTPGLRSLEQARELSFLVRGMRETLRHLDSTTHTTPLLVKLSPDAGRVSELVDACVDAGAAGIIATNTSVARRELLGDDILGRGGVSGSALQFRSLRTIEVVSAALRGRLPLIGVGGIATPEDARRTLAAGADLMQLYTAFIYEGPAVVRHLNRALLGDWLGVLD